MTDPRPRPSRGRGRGKHSDRVIESGEREALSCDRKQEITTEEEDGRWQYDRWTDNDKRFDGGGNTKSAVVNDGGKWKHDRWMDSDVSLVEKQDNKSASPSGRARRTDVIGGSRSDGGKRDGACGEQESISSRPTRNRPKRPEVQRYVPRGRRLQEEAEKRAGKSREDNSAQLNTQKSVTISKSDKSSQLDVEHTCVSAKRTKDNSSQINAEKRMAITKVENFAQINMDETATKSKENNSMLITEKRSGRNPGKNSPQLNAARRVRKSTEDNSLKQCKENWMEMSEGRPDDDLMEFNSKSSSHVDAKTNRGSESKGQTRGNVYVPPGRRKVTSEGGENSNEEVVEMTGDCHLNVSDDGVEGEKMHEGIDRAESKLQESACDEEECLDRQEDAMECSKRQNYGANYKSQYLQDYHHSSEINKNKIEQVSFESGLLLSEANDKTDVLLIEGSTGCTESQICEIGHIKVKEEKVQVHKPEESEKSHSRKDQTENICKEDFEEDLVSMNKKMKVECSDAPLCLEHSKNDENLDDAVNTISCSEISAVVDKDNSLLTSDKKENENLDTSVSKTEEAQTASNESGNEDDVEIGSFRHSEENSTGNDCVNTVIMETNDIMETVDTRKTTGLDDQKISSEKQPESNEVHVENKSTDQKMISAGQQSELQSDTVNEKQTDEASDEKSNDIEDEEEEDSWDKMFDDEGECLDPSAVEELTKKVGKVKIKKAKINYLDFKPKDPDLDYDEMGHVIEIFGFPAEFKTEDLLSIFQPYKDKGFDIKWVDDTHALGVFSSPIAAQSALGLVHPLCKVGPLTDATRASKVKAKRSVEFLQPYKPRPETSAAAARRLVSGALGLSTRVSKEQREKERQKLREAKEKRKMERKQKDDIWEGTCTSSIGHDNR